MLTLVVRLIQDRFIQDFLSGLIDLNSSVHVIYETDGVKIIINCVGGEASIRFYWWVIICQI